MDEGKMPDNHLNSAAAFVEGGILESFDDACSICLEEFCISDPSTLTTCKHEFHLHCILEWCQRSSQCPMCWQSISLKDPSSQELLDAVEHEKNIRMNPPRNTTIFHHPALGDFELQHLPAGATESELEERIIQHLTAAAAMGRARHLARREGRNRSSSAQTRPRFLVFSTQPDGSSVTVGDGHTQPSALMIGDTTTTPFITVGGDSTHHFENANQSGSSSTNNRPATHSSPSSQDQPGPSDLHSFTETVKSRFNLFSSRYKESITKSTRSWKERLFTRNTSTLDEVHGVAAHQGTTTTTTTTTITTASPLMDHLGINEHGESTVPTVSHNQDTSETLIPEISDRHYLEETCSVSPCATSSASN